MGMYKKKQSLYIIFSFCIVFTIVLSGGIVFDEHNCVIINCLDCLSITVSKNITNIDKTLPCFFIYLKPQIHFSEIIEANIKATLLLTKQKVRLNT